MQGDQLWDKLNKVYKSKKVLEIKIHLQRNMYKNFAAAPNQQNIGN